MSYTCRICAHTAGNRTWVCREKMFGLGGEFEYFECSACGCLQIATAPADLNRYYPPHYYSFNLQPVPQRGWKARLAGLRDGWRLTGAPWAALLPGSAAVRPDVASLARLPLRKDWRVLDVGCGRGQLLSILHRAGFRHLLGIDPFLPADVEVLPGLVVRKETLQAVCEQFDLVMLHHVFEHAEDGRVMLAACQKLVRPTGKILARIPTAESLAWERYRENWVQLDAPRHFFLHTRRSLERLAGQAELKLERWWCDSGGFQFWGSELYQKGSVLIGKDGQATPPERHFAREQMIQFERDAAEANAAGRGDQVAAVLVRAGP